MEFKKNELINQVLIKYYETFALTVDTCDYVPDKFNREIHKLIFKEMKKKFKQVNKEYKAELKDEKFSYKMRKFFVSQFGKLFFRGRKKDLEKIDVKNIADSLSNLESGTDIGKADKVETNGGMGENFPHNS